MKKSRTIQTILAILLTFSILTGMLPESLFPYLATLSAVAEEEERGRQLAAQVYTCLNDTFTSFCASVGTEEELSDGLWRYRVDGKTQWAVITGHDDPSAVFLSVPKQLGGADVVALADGALADHRSLTVLDLPGNLNAFGKDAVPQGTTLRGYNASFAQYYADQAGYPFESLSKYDFMPGVVDFGDISTGEFTRYSQKRLSLRKLEAMRLADGSRFFLIDPLNPYQISYYQVERIDEESDQSVLLICSTPEVDKLMYSFSGTDEALVLDVSTLHLEEGVTYEGAGNSGSARTRAKGSRGYDSDVSSSVKPFQFSVSSTMRLAEGVKLNLEGTYKHTIKTTYNGTVYSNKNVEIEDTEEGSFSVGISAETGNQKGNRKDPEPDLKKKNPVEELMKRMNDGWESEAKRVPIPMGTALLFSLGGIINVAAQFDFVAEISGSATFTVSYQSTTVIKGDSDGNQTKETIYNEPKCELKGRISGKLGGEIKIIGCICCVKVIEAAVFFGFQLEVEMDLLTSVNMWDCVTIKISFIIEGSIKAGFLGFLSEMISESKIKNSFSWGASATWLKVEILKMHCHLLNVVLAADPDGGWKIVEKKNQFHLAANCPYNGITASFYMPLFEEDKPKYRILKSVSYLEEGDVIEDLPEDEVLSALGRNWRFDGWYLDEEYSQPAAFPYTVGKENVVFYAKVTRPGHIYCLKSNGEEIMHGIGYPEETFTLPIADTDSETVKWYEVDGPRSRSILGLEYEGEPLGVLNTSLPYPEDGGSRYFMLYLPEDSVLVSFFQDTDGVQTLLDTQIHAPGDEISMPQLAYQYNMIVDGWRDEQGMPVSSPYQLSSLPIDRTFTFCLHSPKAVGGEGTPTSVGGGFNCYAGNTEPVQDTEDCFVFACYQSFSSDEWYATCRGFRSDCQVRTNVVIPSTCTYKYNNTEYTCTVNEIADYAFRGQPILTVRIPSSVTRIGEQVFKDCPNLGKADLSAASVTQLPSWTFSGCEALAEILLPEHTMHIGSNAFSGCYSLSSITVRGSVGAWAFRFCRALENVTLLPGCETIGNFAFADNASLRSAVIQAELTGLPASAFENDPLLEDVSLPATIQSVGASAFCGDTSLQNIILPYGLRSIGGSAFENCSALAALALPGTLTSVGGHAFAGCSSLRSLHFPDSVTSYGEKVIHQCTALEKLYLGSGAEPALKGSNAEAIFSIGSSAALREVEFAEGITEIGENTFMYPSLENVILPSTLKVIQTRAFMNAGIRNIAFPDGIRSIEYYAFTGSALTDISIRGDRCELKYAFVDCPYLRTARLGSGVIRLMAAFQNCHSLEAVELSEGLQEVIYKAFENCSSLRELSLPDSIINFNPGNLKGCTSLETLSIGRLLNSFSHVSNQSDARLYISENPAVKKLIIREGITNIPNVFPYFRQLETVVFPDSLVSIEGGTFANTSIRNLQLPAGIQSIGAGAFRNCDQLVSFEIADSLSRCELTIGDDAFSYCKSLTDVRLKDGLKVIGGGAFSGCTALKELFIPDSVVTFGGGMIDGCSALETLSLPANANALLNGRYPDDALYIGEDASLRFLQLREGITSIGSNAFSYQVAPPGGGTAPSPAAPRGYQNLERIEIPSTLVSIGKRAFIGTHLTEFECNARIAEIGDEAFRGIGTLRRVYLNGNGCSIGNRAFEGCGSLEEAVLGPGIDSIAAYAFANCGSLETVSLSEGIRTMIGGAFSNCTSLRQFRIPDSVTSCGSCFDGCSALEEVTFGTGTAGIWEADPDFFNNNNILYQSGVVRVRVPDGVTRVGKEKFKNVPNLRTVILPASVSVIGSEAFERSPVETVIIYGALDSVGDAAFRDCDSLESISLRCDGTIGGSAFAECDSLTDASISGSAALGSSAFANCSSLETVTLKEGLLSIGASAFAGCSSLKALSIPDSTTSVASSYISGCSGLEEISLGAGCASQAASYGSGFFNIGRETSLRHITLREGITTLGVDFFSNFTYGLPCLESIDLPDSLNSLLASAVRNLVLTQFILPDHITSITAGNFSGMAGVTLVTRTFNETVNTYAANKNLAYVVMDGDSCPYYPVELRDADTGEVYGTNQVRYLSAISLPDAQPPEGKLFAGWYLDEACTIPLEQGRTMQAAGLVLYTRCISAVRTVFALQIPRNHTMSGLMSGAAFGLPGSFGVYSLQACVPGESVQWPEDPELDGCLFDGWYEDEAFSVPAEAVTADQQHILYGRFLLPGNGGVYGGDSEGAVITSWSASSKEGGRILIPEVRNGKPVTGIGPYAFTGCSPEEIILPSSLEYVDPLAFSGLTSLRKLTVSTQNDLFCTVNGILYSKDRTVLYRCPPGIQTGVVSLPDSVRTIAPYAFADCRDVREVVFPESLQSIGGHAFENCRSLNGVILPDQAAEIGERAFAGCANLVWFEAPGASEIGPDALPVNILMQVYGPEGDCALREWCVSNLPENSYNTAAVKICNGTTVINAFLVEAGTLLTPAAASGKVRSGEVIAGLYRNTALTDAWNIDADPVPAGGITLYVKLVNEYVCSARTLAKPDGSGYINGVSLDAYNGTDTDIVIPSSIDGKRVIRLGSRFLKNHPENISSVSVGPNVIGIADDAFAGPDGNDLPLTILSNAGSYADSWAGEHGFQGASASYTLSFDTLGGGTINSRQAQPGTLIRLPDAVRSGYDFLGWCTSRYHSSSRVSLNDDGLYTMPGGDTVLYALYSDTSSFDVPFTFMEKDGAIIITGYTGTESSVAIPGEINGLPVKTIGKRAFARSAVSGVSFGSVERIERQAFEDCPNLQSVDLAGVKTLEDYAFAYCPFLQNVSLGSSLEKIGDHAFLRTAVESFSGGDTPVYRNVDGQIWQGTKLVLFPPARTGDLTLPEGTTAIAPYAFEYSRLKNLTANAELAEVGREAFLFSSLEKIDLTPAQLGSVPVKMAAGSSKLEEVLLGDSVTSIESCAFANCISLVKAVIPANVTQMHDMCFCGNDSDLAIYGSPGSRAAEWALDHDVRFVPDQAAEELIISADHTELVPGETIALDYEVVPASLQDSLFVRWYSGDSDIVAVRNDGTAVALGCGETQIFLYASDGTVSSLTLSVHGLFADSIRLETRQDMIAVGFGKQLNAVISPAGAESGDLTWSSDHPEIVSTDDGGMITAHAAGNAVITVRNTDGIGDAVSVEAYIPVESVSWNQAPGTMDAIPLHLTDGLDSCRLIPEIVPLEAVPKFTWQSSRPDIVSVDQQGNLQALAYGRSEITAATGRTPTGETLSFSWMVHVFRADIADAVYEPDIRVVCTGERVWPPLKITYKGKELEKDVHYLVEDSYWCDPGSYTVTIGGLDAFTGYLTIPFEIIDYYGTLHASAAEIRMQKGQTLRVDGWFVPEPDAPVDSLEMTWSSSEPGTVSTDGNGNLTALSAGDAVITLSAEKAQPSSISITVHVPEGTDWNTLQLPGSLKQIEEEALAGVAADRIVSGSSLTGISSRAFAGSVMLKQVFLNSQELDSISPDALEDTSACIVVKNGFPVSLLRESGIPYLIRRE